MVGVEISVSSFSKGGGAGGSGCKTFNFAICMTAKNGIDL